LRITHFSETTKDRNLIFGMGGDANVKLSSGWGSQPLKNSFQEGDGV
jgi:hypothetical protein